MSDFEDRQDKQDAAEIKNYTRTPNMLISGYRNISPQEKWLYVSLKHMCGKEGTRHLSLRYISEQTGISTGALSSSKNAKGVVNLGMMRHLHDSGLIHCEIKKHDGKGNPQYHVTITDIWALNQDFFMNRPKSEQVAKGRENPSERLTPSSEIRTDRPVTRPKSEQACPNSGTNIRLDNKTTITDKITKQEESIVVSPLVENNAPPILPSTTENDSQPALFPSSEILPIAATTIPEQSTLLTLSQQSPNGKETRGAKQASTNEVTKLVLPTNMQAWSAETLVQTFEFHRGRTYPNGAKRKSDRVRDTAVEAAKTLMVDAADIWTGHTTEQNAAILIRIIQNLETKWWLDANGNILPHQLVDKDRIHTAYNRINASAPTIPAKPIDISAQREAARIKNLAAMEKIEQVKAKQALEKQQLAGKRIAL